MQLQSGHFKSSGMEWKHGSWHLLASKSDSVSLEYLCFSVTGILTVLPACCMSSIWSNLEFESDFPQDHWKQKKT